LPRNKNLADFVKCGRYGSIKSVKLHVLHCKTAAFFIVLGMGRRITSQRGQAIAGTITCTTSLEPHSEQRGFAGGWFRRAQLTRPHSLHTIPIFLVKRNFILLYGQHGIKMSALFFILGAACSAKVVCLVVPPVSRTTDGV